MSQSLDFWNRIAEKYAASPIRDMEGYEATLDMTRKYLKPTDHVLELGCGTGTTAMKLAPNVGHMTATDYAEAMVEIGNRKAAEDDAENVTFLQADPFDPMLEKEPYDVVMGWNFYHLLNDMSAGFRRSHALLKPNGLLIAKTPSLGDTPFMKRMMFKVAVPIMKLLGKAPTFVGFVTVAEVEQAVKDAGFVIIETKNTGGTVPRSFLIARKV